MHDEIQGMIERAECEHHADRLVGGEGQPTCRRRIEVHGNFAAGLRAQMFDADLHAVDGAIDFHQ